MALLKGWRFPNWVTLPLALLFAAAWLVLSIVVKDLEEWHVPKLLSEISIEFFKAIIIGVMVGVGVEVVLKISEIWAERDTYEKSAASMLTACEVQRLYEGRRECIEVLKNLVENPHVQQVCIAGISLREFLRPDGRMRQIWELIVQRLRREVTDRIDDSQRLKVKLLLLDPLSAEGRFRYRIEEQAEGDPDNAYDIDQALNEIRRVKKWVYDDKPGEFLQARLYGHCPFSFMFLTEGAAFVEQYFYRKSTTNLTPPVLEYQSPSERSVLFRLSFNIMWKRAHEERIAVGTALPIERASIKNIFRAEQRAELTNRQVASIQRTNTGTIDILAISGNHYVNNMSTVEALHLVSSTKSNSQAVTVRLAVLNPVSQQAILRAVADDRTVVDIRDALGKWNWEKHRHSRLYQDIHRTMNRVANWKERGYLFELRLYSSSVACAVLVTSSSVFVEQYVYGRTKKLQKRDILIGEYPVIEYAVATSNGDEELLPNDKDKTEHEIISSNFQIVWDCYSLAAEEFLERTEEDQFTKSLNSLHEELGCLADNAVILQGTDFKTGEEGGGAAKEVTEQAGQNQPG